jgi:hypothetical protein
MTKGRLKIDIELLLVESLGRRNDWHLCLRLYSNAVSCVSACYGVYERVLSEWICISPSPRRESTCYLVCEPLKSQLSHRSVRSTPGVGSSLFYACDKNVIKRLHTAERRYAYAWTSNEETQTRRPRSYISSMALSRFLTLTNFI